MNNFLQRMLKKSDDESEGERIILDSSRREYSPGRNKSSNWGRKLDTCSPRKLEFSPCSTRSPSRPIIQSEDRNNAPITRKSTTIRDGMPDLEKIIREFEQGFLSPTKREMKETAKAGRFVKKIVAAFEEKYKACNEFRNSSSESSYESDDSWFEKRIEESAPFLSTTYVIESRLESRLSDYLDSHESSFRAEQLRNDDQSSIDLGKCSFAMDEELRMSTPTKETRHEEATVITRETNNETLEMTASSLARSDSSIRRKPKVVGAYLKKPIEVDEETSIDWIPIMGKKLPRKRSFKKLLSMLTGKKSSDKSSKLYCSQMNLREETARELLHDSGYDEKSCSSSSLVSITDLLMMQHEVDDRRPTGRMTTFRQSPSNDKIDSSFIGDDASDTCSISSRKLLLLEQVPRSELRLSLGPAFPTGERIPSNRPESSTNESISDSLDDFFPSPLPKHPFISMGKNSSDGGSENSSSDNPCNMSFSELDTIELRRDQTWKFPTDDITYDVPRRFKSEPGLARRGNIALPIVYDVPKIPQRPRSSVYDDAVSLKRRNANLPICHTRSNEFYAFPCHQEPHYATVKPRNTRYNPSRELLRSVSDLNEMRNY